MEAQSYPWCLQSYVWAMEWSSTYTQGCVRQFKRTKDNDRFDKEYTEEFKASLLSDAFQVAIKIRSSVVDLYMLKMENACLIRKNAENIRVATNHFLLTGTMEEKHYYIVRAEIDQFRELFKIWVSTFEKDEHEDEWGLFN